MTTTLDNLADILKKIEVQCEKNGKDIKELKSDIGKEIYNIKEEIKNVKTTLNVEVTKIKSNISEIKTSQTFIGTQFDDHKKIIENVMKKNKQLEEENTAQIKQEPPVAEELCGFKQIALKLDKSNFATAGFFMSFVQTINCILYAFVLTLGFNSS